MDTKTKEYQEYQKYPELQVEVGKHYSFATVVEHIEGDSSLSELSSDHP